MDKNLSTQSQTEILHTRISGEAYPSVTPLFQNSAFESNSSYFYTRKANPNSVEFELVISKLAKAKHAISTTTGMTAIALVINLLKPGQAIVLNKDIYGCTYKLFQRVAEKRQLNLISIDLSIPSEWNNIPDDVDLVFFETPTNPFLKTITIQDFSNFFKSKSPNCLVTVDNTWATPLFQKPLQLGADITLHSATKYFSGHSDVMGGVLLTDNDNIAEELSQERFYTGAILAPHSAWLLRRSLQTFSLRLEKHQEITIDMSKFLSDIPQVSKIYYPEVDGKQMTGYGGILFFDLSKEHQNKYESFKKNLNYFSTGTGMACVTSMIAQPYSGSHASLSEEEKKSAGISESLVRLCFGFEDIDDLKSDLKQAFDKL